MPYTLRHQEKQVFENVHFQTSVESFLRQLRVEKSTRITNNVF